MVRKRRLQTTSDFIIYVQGEVNAGVLIRFYLDLRSRRSFPTIDNLDIFYKTQDEEGVVSFAAISCPSTMRV